MFNLVVHSRSASLARLCFVVLCLHDFYRGVSAQINACTLKVCTFNYTECGVEIPTFRLRAPPAIHTIDSPINSETRDIHSTEPPRALKIDFQKHFRKIPGRDEPRKTSRVSSR